MPRPPRRVHIHNPDGSESGRGWGDQFAAVFETLMATVVKDLPPALSLRCVVGRQENLIRPSPWQGGRSADLGSAKHIGSAAKSPRRRLNRAHRPRIDAAGRSGVSVAGPASGFSGEYMAGDHRPQQSLVTTWASVSWLLFRMSPERSHSRR
jgi:hypothetical protein